MTIVQPNRNRHAALAIKLLLGAIGVMGVVSVFLYNGMVGVRASRQQSEKSVQLLRVENADLKNEYFARIDGKSLVEVVERLGYVKDARPGYLTLEAEPAPMSKEEPVVLTIHTSVYAP